MNRKIYIALLCALMAVPAFLVCSNAGSKVKNPVVAVGNTTIGMESFETFQKVVSRYPSPMPPYFPAMRQPITIMTDVEAIYQHVNAIDKNRAAEISEEIASSLDWKWRVKYFTASLFFELLNVNLGFTDAELSAHYKKSPETYRISFKTEDGRDTSFIPTFDNAKRQIADNLFLEKYPPDSAFVARIESENHDHDHDDAVIRNHWLYSIRSNPADFYMRRFFFERTGQLYTDDEMLLYGEGNAIQSPDLDVIRSWVPASRRGMRMKELIEWLYKWEIFAEHAQKTGLVNGSDLKEMLHWASRIEFAQTYLRSDVVSNRSGDTASVADATLAELLLYDQMRRIEPPTVQSVQSEFNNIFNFRIAVAVDSVTHFARRNIGVTFKQDEIADERDTDPAMLLAKADSLRDAAVEMELTGSNVAIEEAEKIYRTIAENFAFTPEGRKAMGEIAKIQTDKFISSDIRADRLMISALQFYRRAQILETDEDNLCNSVFMTGFAYDEHLKNYALAEVNYKWVLRNTPNCEQAADAEFMLLHLGEPMTSIEEIQGRSLRQGRDIDFDGGIEGIIDEG